MYVKRRPVVYQAVEMLKIRSIFKSPRFRVELTEKEGIFFMKKTLFLFLTFVVSVASTPVKAMNSTEALTPFPTKSALDLDLDLGISLKKEDSLIFSRLRTGKLWRRDENILAVGIDLGKFSNFGFGGGVEGEWIHLPSGMWIQGKALTTQNEILVTGLGLGWSLFGVEGLVSPFNSSKAAIYAKVRLPIGLLIQ